MKKKLIITTLLIITILITASLVTSFKDNARIRAGIEPIYTIQIKNEKENKITYIGLGYKIVRYIEGNMDEPFGKNDNYKYGSWFMNYENPKNEN